MIDARSKLRDALSLEHYPRSATYDPMWIVDNLMGPHPLWLAEALAQVMPLQAGSRVLDLGCGTALTSIFLAREFGVEVWAYDLWTDPTDNWQRIKEADLAGRVHPLHGDARSMPFPNGFFDTIVSFDAFHYFGTDVTFLPSCIKHLAPRGQIGMVSPGLRLEPYDPLPDYLARRWVGNPGMCAYLSPHWWRTHWERTGLVEIAVADMVPHGAEDWLTWLDACDLVGRGFEPDAEMLRADQGRLLGFTRILAHLKG